MVRRLILPIVALAVAAGTVMYAKNFLGQSSENRTDAESTVEVAPTRQVLVAVETIAPGRFLPVGSLAWQDWPDVDLPDAYFVDQEVPLDELGKAVSRQGLRPGEPLTENDIVFPGERGFLAAVLEPGKRAVSVPINETSSNAGLILPGDKVDLILTQAITDEMTGRERFVSETVLEDARVIAMGRRLQPGGDEASPLAPVDVRTATLEVSPQGAELVALVVDLGRLTMSLRSLSDPEALSMQGNGRPAAANGTRTDPMANADNAPFTRDSDVSQMLRLEDEAQDVLRLVRGPEQQLLDLEREPGEGQDR